MASVLKTDIGKPIVGSNPTSSAQSGPTRLGIHLSQRHVANPTLAPVAVGKPLVHTCYTTA